MSFDYLESANPLYPLREGVSNNYSFKKENAVGLLQARQERFSGQELEVSLLAWMWSLLVLCHNGSSSLRVPLVGSSVSFLEAFGG